MSEVSVYFTKHAMQRFRERGKVGASVKNNRLRARMRLSLLRSTRLPADRICGVKQAANSIYLYDAERELLHVLAQKRGGLWLLTCLKPAGHLKGSITKLRKRTTEGVTDE